MVKAAKATKQKEAWKQEGVEVYFIDADLSHTLFEGRIETVNGD